MAWLTILFVAALAGYIILETYGKKLYEGFAIIPRRTFDEEPGWSRDLRYTSAFANVQGLEVAGDFCRALVRKNDPKSLHVACALAAREGMDPMEYHGRAVGDGFIMSRDDYWKVVTNSGRTDYCRIMQDPDTELWYSGCAVAGPRELGPREIHDVSPPPYIKSLIEAYESALAWYRWQDDEIDYTNKSAIEVHGKPIFPSLLRPLKTRGLQLNRDPDIPMNDILRWGERQTLMLDQVIMPNQIRAISFWIWWDSFEKNSRVLECSNGPAKKDLVWLGVEGGGPPVVPAPLVIQQAAEVRPDHYAVQNRQVEDVVPCIPDLDKSVGNYVFEIWDKDQRIMRLRGPASAKTNEWQHVIVTTTDTTTWWPTWQLWVNGTLCAEKKDGRSIPALTLKNNMIGQFRGCIQDFRIYKKPMGPEQIKTTMAFAKPLLHPNP